MGTSRSAVRQCQGYNRRVRVTWLLAFRFLRRRSSPLLAASSRAALVAVALGVAALVVVLALMSGYRAALTQGILAASGHVLVVPAPGESEEELARLFSSRQGVAAVGRSLFVPGLAATSPQAQGEVITLKAADQLPPFVPELSPSGAGPLPVAVGEGLSARLKVKVGDVVFLQLAQPSGRLAYVPARVAAVFSTGFSEFRDSWLFCRFQEMTKHGRGWGSALVEVYLKNPDDAERFAEAWGQELGPRALLRSWSGMNRELFAALRWQKITLTLVLSLIVGVGAFEVASAIVVLITEKRRELGILLAMGASPSLVRRTVITAGGLLGVGGVVVGTVFGLGLVGVLAALGIPRFSSELASIYMVSRIPWQVRLGDVLWVVAAGAFEVLLASVAAARPLASRQPAEVLRWV